MFKLNKQPDYLKIEKQVLEFWKKERIFEKSIKARPAAKTFVFYEGPPTANGQPGIHHVLARAYKDIICRFKTMKGFKVPRQAGWDTHGLPVEIEIEKQLKISGKDEIECLVPGDKRQSIIKFNQLCKQSVFRYRQDWEKMTERIGFWLDMEHPFVTYENSYIEQLWLILKKIWQKKLLYTGHKVLPYCYRCGTALSSHEVAQGYQDITEPAIYVKFRVKRGPSSRHRAELSSFLGTTKKVFFVAWTTTPWTLPGNAALAVGKEIDYLLVKKGGEELILAKDLAQQLLTAQEYQKIKQFKGKELVGWEYQPLYDVIPLKTKDKYRVVEADFVTTDEGSGIVHTAVMYGEDDYQLAEKYHLPKFHTVDEAGRFVSQVKQFQGLNVHQANPQIVQDLSDRNLLFKQVIHSHNYPFCWRCDSPLIYYAKTSWFIKMTGLKNQLIQNNRQINWLPAHLKQGRFGQWLAEVKDWAISRERYWATPLPIWQCQKCSHRVCLGSLKELKQLASRPVPRNLDLHRPYIDEIKLNCPQCSSLMDKDPAVIDVWFDSGAMPFASGADQKIGFPADYISEAIDQTRGWFYTLLAISTLLDKGPSFKNVISLGHILDEKGHKMSKSLGNVIEPKQILDKFGADNLRFYLFTTNQPGSSKKFSQKDLTTCVRKNLMIWWNLVLFFETYQAVDKVKIVGRSTSRHFLDVWLAERTNQLVKEVTEELDNYQVTNASRQIESYISELSTWYLRISRKRRDKDFYESFYGALMTLTKLLAPFMPLVSEYIYQNLRKKSDPLSVHLADFPSAQPMKNRHLAIAQKMQKIISQALSQRQQKGIRLRQLLTKLEIRGWEVEERLAGETKEILKQETNVLELVLKPGKALSVKLDLSITPELEREGIVRDLKRQIQQLRRQANCQVSDVPQLAILADSQPWLKKYFPAIEKATLVKIQAQVDSPDAEGKLGDIALKLKR